MVPENYCLHLSEYIAWSDHMFSYVIWIRTKHAFPMEIVTSQCILNRTKTHDTRIHYNYHTPMYIYDCINLGTGMTWKHSFTQIFVSVNVPLTIYTSIFCTGVDSNLHIDIVIKIWQKRMPVFSHLIVLIGLD